MDHVPVSISQAGMERDLEKSVRGLQLSVVMRTDKKQPIGVGSYSNVYEVIVHKTVCAAKATILCEISETKNSPFFAGVFKVVKYFIQM